MMERTKRAAALQESHDALIQQLAVLVGQTIYGHHGITRMQVLTALDAMHKAIELQVPHKNTVTIHESWINEAKAKAGL